MRSMFLGSACALALAGAANAAPAGDPALLFRLSGDKGLVADIAAA